MINIRNAVWASIVIGLLSVFLCGCSSSSMMEQRLWQLNHDPYADTPKEHMDMIVEAVSNSDAEAIYNMFSKNVRDAGLAEEDIHKLIDALADIVADLESDGLASEEGYIHYGKQIRELSYFGTIEQSDILYVISIRECVRDDWDTDNVGLTRIVFYPDEGEFPDVAATGVHVVESGYQPWEPLEL